jgi:GPI-GlcNAc transferase complex, PIG-H component
MTTDTPAHTSTLYIIRQDPALVEYSVSSNSRFNSTTVKLFKWSIISVKIALICLNFYWWLIKSKQQKHELLNKMFTHSLASHSYVLGWAFSLMSITFVLRRMDIEESFLVVQSFGLQVSSSGWWYIFGSRSRFIPSSDVLDIIIHEAFIGFEVRYILVVVVKNQSKLQLVFGNILPRREVLEAVLRGSRECFYRDREKRSVKTSKGRDERKNGNGLGS